VRVVFQVRRGCRGLLSRQCLPRGGFRSVPRGTQDCCRLLGIINAIPFRGSISDDVCQVDVTIKADLGGEKTGTYNLLYPLGLLSFAWMLLLARAAADSAVPDGALLRMIKDAADHGVPA